VLVGPSGSGRSAQEKVTTAARGTGQAVEGARWMPWRWTPMKDVASRRNAAGSGLARRSAGLRMGQPTLGYARVPLTEHIGGEEGTGGTETSQYPEERIHTPLVAASERGPA
jgi:hypothetical protein